MGFSGPVVLLIGSFILAYLGSVVYFLVSARRSDFLALLKVGLFFLCTAGACMAIFAFFAAGARHANTDDIKYMIYSNGWCSHRSVFLVVAANKVMEKSRLEKSTH
jgi:hypothetical protein